MNARISVMIMVAPLLTACVAADMPLVLSSVVDELPTLPQTVSILPEKRPDPRLAGIASLEVSPPVKEVGFVGVPAAPKTAMMRQDSAQAPQAAPAREIDRLIAKYASVYELPEELVRRVVRRESNFNPAARNRIYWGLMQIRHDTAQTMGYRGPASGLLDPDINLKYAVKYLRGAWLVARGNADRAVAFYASGYYYDAKRMGLLEETGLKPSKRSRI